MVVVDTTSGSAKNLLVSNYSQTPTDGHLSTMGTSLQWPLMSVLADSSYNASCLNLSIMATSRQKQRPLKHVPNYQFFQRLMKKSRMVMKFDYHDILIVFLLYCCSKHKLSTILMKNLKGLSPVVIEYDCPGEHSSE